MLSSKTYCIVLVLTVCSIANSTSIYAQVRKDDSRGEATTSIRPMPMRDRAQHRAVVAPQATASSALLLTDTAFGFDLVNDTVGSFTLNAPNVVNGIGFVPHPFLPGAEFGNDGDFSFFYAFDSNSFLFTKVIVSTGTIFSVGPAATFGSENWTGLAMDPTTGVMYASSTDGVANSLYTIDLSTGASTRIGAITNASIIIAIAIDNSGQLFGHDIGADVLMNIDKATGAGTVIGPTGFDANFAQGMDFDESTGVLYLAALNNTLSTSELRIANTTTGATTLLGELGATSPGVVEFGGLAIAIKSPLVGLPNSPALDTTFDGGLLPKMKYLSFDPSTNGTRLVQIKVTETSTGKIGYVDLGNVANPAVVKNRVVLVPTPPPAQDWSATPLVNVTGCIIQADTNGTSVGHSYEVTAIDPSVSLSSVPLAMTTIASWGNVNADSVVDIVDVVAAIGIFSSQGASGPVPAPHIDVTNGNEPEGSIDIVDVVAIIGMFSTQGNPPAGVTQLMMCP